LNKGGVDLGIHDGLEGFPGLYGVPQALRAREVRVDKGFLVLAIQFEFLLKYNIRINYYQVLLT
jgi:hypothetical protein